MNKKIKQNLKKIRVVKKYHLIYLALILPLFGFAGSVPNDKAMSFFGVVSYKKTQPIYSGVRGVVSKIYVQGGEKIKKDQRLVEVNRMEFGYEKIVIKNELSNAIVSRVNTLEQYGVEPLTEILVVADTSAFVVHISMSQTDFDKISNLNSISVEFLPSSNTSINKVGKILATHEPRQGKFGLFQVEILVECESGCMDKTLSGSVAKVLFSVDENSNKIAQYENQNSIN